MAFNAYPDIPLSQSSTFELDQRIIESQFGDGYSQRAIDGLNSIMMKPKLRHDNITQTELNTLMTFWRNQGRVEPFTLVVPFTGETVQLRFMSALNIQALAGAIYSVSVDTIQDFALTS